MNVGASRPAGGAVLPDPWTTSVRPYPEALQPYFTFVQRQVMEHTSDGSFGIRDLARFLQFMATHGLSSGTIGAVVRQLIEERRGGGRWKRAALLDRLQFDVFAWYYRRFRPQFATFFLNSTAHYQHLYWREMDPVAVHRPADRRAAAHVSRCDRVRLSRRWIDSSAVSFDLADAKTTIVMATALSQQPCLMFEAHGGKYFYRPKEWSTHDLCRDHSTRTPHRR